MSKLWLIYYISGMQIYLLFTEQILQYGLRVKGDKSSSTFYNKSSNVVLSATSNFWGNIQIVRTHIFKHNILNSVSFTTRYLDFGILYCYFKHTSDEVIYYVLNNVEDTKKIHFSTQKISAAVVLLERCTNIVSLRILFALVNFQD